MDVQRLAVISSPSFEDVIAAFEDAIGHPNLSDLQGAIGAMRSYADLEEFIQRSLGRSGFRNWRVLTLEQSCAGDAGRTSRRACAS
jgi:hypothetical protein